MGSRSEPQSRKIDLHCDEETPRLPEEVIIENILPRLPVKSLLKFRCVAKSWCSLIGSKRFMNAHLKNSIKSSEPTHHRILLETTQGFNQCSLQSLFNKPFTVPITADIGIDFKRKFVSLVGCCNGLVCILLDPDNFILWNPATKKFKNLPDFNNKTGYRFIRKCGLGFDELSDDYKVLGVVVEPRESIADRLVNARVYSLRSNSWKDIEEMDFYPLDQAGLYINGKVHWCTRDALNIVAFDLNSCVYGVVEQPSYANGVYCSLGVVGGCLSARFSHPNGALDIWIMKEYGVKESWCKVVTVRNYMHPYFREFRTPLVIPLAIDSNGEVLLKYSSSKMIITSNGRDLLKSSSSILMYNPKCDVFRHPQISGRGSFDSLGCVGVYIESLASVES